VKTPSYLLESARFDFGDGSDGHVRFIGENANLKKTHITFIVGANGTGKSRMLASLVDAFNEQHSQNSIEEKYYRQLSGSHNLPCIEIVARAHGISDETRVQHSEEKKLSTPHLPSRILAISNLVIDKFPYRQDSIDEDQFYYYLGVRQATNLTTTGSTDRAVAESVIRMLADSTRLEAFGSWIDMVFGNGREIAFGFNRRKLQEIRKFLKIANKLEYIQERLERRMGSRRADMISGEELLAMTGHIEELFTLLENNLQTQLYSKVERATLRLATLQEQDKSNLSRLVIGFLAASRAGISVWPSLLFEGRSWLGFEELSSGQQNLLSVGAKVIAYATPGCLVVIDEPEVSLNVIWQQRYVELLQKSLAGATGSHVIIATHSPHMLSSVAHGLASIVTLGRKSDQIVAEVQDGVFEGWGSESVLYNVLQIPSASNYHLTRELSAVLKHIQDGGKDRDFLNSFMTKISRINYKGIEPLALVVKEVQTYLERLN
jgi:ABC-type cobalamin/Fe3+-siderophores transport system ATPase subunit